jgi:hypothetical protein
VDNEHVAAGAVRNGLAGALAQHPLGAGLALPFSCLVWWKGVQPRWRRRAAADLASIPTSRIKARS